MLAFGASSEIDGTDESGNHTIILMPRLLPASIVPCRRLAHWRFIGVGAVLAIVLPLLAQDQPSVATHAIPSCVLLSIEGRVEIARGGGTNWLPARTNSVLGKGDLLRTGPRSRASVRLTDTSVLRLDERTTVIPEPGQGQGLKLNRGRQYFLNREKPGTFHFRTALTSGAIRGTEFVLAADETGRTEVYLLEGEVDLDVQGQAIRLQAGEQAIIEAGRTPLKTPMLKGAQSIQWCLYYPGVLDASELPWNEGPPEALRPSLRAYQLGNLRAALDEIPAAYQPVSDPERIYWAALLLSVGRVDACEQALAGLEAIPGATDLSARLAHALRQVIAAVQNGVPASNAPPQLATEWLALSYGEQSQRHLESARQAARQAVGKSPLFGFGWARLAELEFGFGSLTDARKALDKAESLSPQNAQVAALQGFAWAARNQVPKAHDAFESAIRLDASLGNGWLGRGLCRIRQGQTASGRQDLQVAALVEPQRALFRDYLAKAYSQDWNLKLARKEIERAKNLDAQDPTAWLYAALLEQQENRVNEGIRDLERSRELNDNRNLFRSQLLLDQDRAVRSANLAALYRDAGLTDASLREASRAVGYDYANGSAHLFLANSFDARREPQQTSFRYETPWFSELLLAHLLAPAGAGSLSQHVSQQEYSRLLERNGLGISSVTEYRSRGDWYQAGSQFGVFGNVSYALDADYHQINGQRANNDLESLTLYARLKVQVTPKDSVFLMANTYDYEAGDVWQYYDPASASRTLRVKEDQEPNLFVGYHRSWSPSSHTLLLLSRLDDRLSLRESNLSSLVLTRNPDWVNRVAIIPNSFFPEGFDLAYDRSLEAYSAELQQILVLNRHTFIAGGRYQFGWPQVEAVLDRDPRAPPPLFAQPPSEEHLTSRLDRGTAYLYDFWQVLDPLQVHLGLSYDHLRYPANIETPPLDNHEKSASQWSPKAGLVWTLQTNTHLYGSWTRSLGGVYYDASVRLEPTQIAGFNQMYRSLIPESAPNSASGAVPGAKFETRSLGFDCRFPTGTYLGLSGEWLCEKAGRTLGAFNYNAGRPMTSSFLAERLEYEEKALRIGLHQLLGNQWAAGVQYQFSRAELQASYPEIPSFVQQTAPVKFDSATDADLHQMLLYLAFNHPSGLFSRFESQWFHQHNRGYQPALAGDDFWQCHWYVGYRFKRRAAEIQLGLMNLTDQDYHLNPLNLNQDMMRDRTFVCRLQFHF